MTSTPLSLAMSGLDSPFSGNGTPRKQSKSHLSPVKTAYDQSSGLSLNLQCVLGTTISSVNGFDYLTSKSWFATCAGSAGVINYVDEDFNIIQRFFRARPNIMGTLVSADPVTPSTADWRSRQFSSLRGNNSNAKGSASDYLNSPGKVALRQKTRAASCISLSPDGRILAVGETGYVPRILLFFATSNSTESPYCMLPEHGFGVRSLSFSPDSRWLFSVGDVHDGFVFLWSINQRSGTPKLYASNRCTSFVHDMAWVGNSVVTVGTRHVKVWRPDSTGPPSPSKSKFRSDSNELGASGSAPKTLMGRNCILGNLLESTFTCIASLSDAKAVICTDKGEVCILDDTYGGQRLYRTRKLEHSVRCITVDMILKKIWIGGRNGEIHSYSYSDIETVQTSRSSDQAQNSEALSNGSFEQACSTSVALGLVRGRVISIGSDHHLRILDIDNKGSLDQEESYVKHLPSHSGPVLGVDVSSSRMVEGSAFMTWDATGTVIFWTLDGLFIGESKVPLEQMPTTYNESVETNELKILRSVSSGKYYVSGDKFGVLRLLSCENWPNGSLAKSHNGEINDIVTDSTSYGMVMIASCGRDRTVQLYEEKDMELNLLQTIDQHGSSVNALMLLNAAQTLLSASSDRTVIVHSLAEVDGSNAYVPTRVLTLKQSPLSLALDSDDQNIISVTTMDKQLHRYELSSGQCVVSTRLLDDNNTPVLLTSTETRTINSSSGALRLLLGVSSTDKSVRVHDLESGYTLVTDYGHSEGITDVAIIREQRENETSSYIIASTGLDGTVMLWELSHSSRADGDQSPCATTLPETPSFAQPLRRVLSKTAIAEFSRTLEASGMSPVPPTPSRSHSPSRLRKKLSKYSLGGIHTPNVTASATLRRPERSPSPPSPATPSSNLRKPIHRTKSLGNFNDVNFAADQLCKSLRAFRKKVTSSSDVLALQNVKELEREINQTVKIIGQHSKRHQQLASDTNLGDLLDQYSEKLAQMVEEKVALSVAKGRRQMSHSDGGGVSEGSMSTKS